MKQQQHLLLLPPPPSLLKLPLLPQPQLLPQLPQRQPPPQLRVQEEGSSAQEEIGQYGFSQLLQQLLLHVQLRKGPPLFHEVPLKVCQ